MSLRVSLSRIYRFSAAHRLHAAALSEEENRQVYDKCNNLYGHGHDYRLEVTVSGKPAADTGMIMPLEELDTRVGDVLKELDYRHLDKEVPFFSSHLSTGEVIIRYLWERLAAVLGRERLYHLKLWETNNNYFEISRESI